MAAEKDFTEKQMVTNHETASTAVAEQAKAIIFSHYELALRRPRDVDQARQSLLKECRRPSFADIARYNKPIGNGVVGPSIRFAEAAIRNYKNICVMTKTVYDDNEKRIVNVNCIDVEENTSYNQDVTITKTVERKKIKPGEKELYTRMNSKNETLYILPATDDDILNKQNALISKAIRTLGLRLIPADIIDECMEEVVKTQQNRDAEDPDASKRKIFDSFESIGVQAKEVKAYLGHNAETLTPKELASLRGIFQAIKDGELSWRDVIDKPADKTMNDIPMPEEVKPETKTSKPKAQAPTPQSALSVELITDAQQKRLFEIWKASGKTEEERKRIIDFYGFKSSKDITKAAYEEICTAMQSKIVSEQREPGQD